MSKEDTTRFYFYVAVLSPSGENFRRYSNRYDVERSNFTANYTCRSRKVRDAMKVTKGDRIGVATLNTCLDNVCPFQTVVNNTESPDIILYGTFTFDRTISRNSLENRTNTAIHFRAYIDSAGEPLSHELNKL